MNPPIISQMLAGQMSYMTDRQTVLAQNMANIDTPAYPAQDLKKLDFAQMASDTGGRLGMLPAEGKSLGSTLGQGNKFSSEKIRKAAEITPTGGSVVLEEQMGKISDTGAQFQIASTLYRKFNTLYNEALGKNS